MFEGRDWRKDEFTVHTQLRVTLQGNPGYNLVLAAHFLLLHWQQPASQFGRLCYSCPETKYTLFRTICRGFTVRVGSSV